MGPGTPGTWAGPADSCILHGSRARAADSRGGQEGSNKKIKGEGLLRIQPKGPRWKRQSQGKKQGKVESRWVV